MLCIITWQVSFWSTQYLNPIGPDFLYFFLVFVSRDFELGTNVSCEELAISPLWG